MKFQTVVDESLQEKDIVPQGEHKFEIIRSEELLSKKQIPMLKLTLRIEHEGAVYWIVDFLSEKIIWKIKYFMNTIGLSENYSLGELTVEDCLGKTGKVKIVQEYSDSYGIQSIVSKYISIEESNSDK